MIENTGIYRINQTYQQNVDLGPIISPELKNTLLKTIDYKEQSIDFLGFKLNNPLGVPAGPLLDSQWIDLASKLNFSVLTYKTIRSDFYPSHQLPNMISVSDQLIDPKKTDIEIYQKKCTDLTKLTITNSFGMPSQSQAYLREDLIKAKSLLKKGQILVISTVASDMNDIVNDFYKTAQFAKDYGADAVEINLSCPNVKDSSSMLYLDSELSFKICQKITHNLKIPLIIKVGYFKNDTQLKNLLIAADRSKVAAISGINSFSTKVYQTKNSSRAALDNKRLSAGICGYAIQNLGLDFTAKVRGIIDQNQLSIQIIGMGGVMKAADFKSYLDKGADIAMSATAMIWLPLIARDYAFKYQKDLITN